MQDADRERLIRRIKNKKVLTDADLEVLAQTERARFLGRVE